MTPHEKAIELKKRFRHIAKSYKEETELALIVVDEIIKGHTYGDDGVIINMVLHNYWQEVKEELKKPISLIFYRAAT